MLTRHVLILHLLLTSPTVWAQTYGCRADYPVRVVSETPFSITVSYDAPEAPTTLHCEPKRLDNVVFDAQTVRVSGRGTHTFDLVAPRLDLLGEFRIALWMGDDWRDPVGQVIHTDPIRVISQAEQRRLETLEQSVATELDRLGYAPGAPAHIAVLDEDLPGVDRDVVEALAMRLAADGASVTRLDAAAMANPYLVTSQRFDLLVLVHPRQFPAAGVETVDSYAQAGGKLMVLGSGAFDEVLWPFRDAWLSRAGLTTALSDAEGQAVVFDFEDNLPEMARATNEPGAGSTASLATRGADGSDGCLQLSIRDLSGWDTFQMEALPQGFPEGHEMTCFSARSTTGTQQLVVEWVEEDGSRWMAVVPLHEEWTRYALLPGQFEYWRDSSSVGRGGAGDRLNPAQARRLTFGLAFTHSTAVARGDHTILIDNIATAPVPADLEGLIATAQNVSVPYIEGVSPSYKTYPISTVRELQVADPLLWSGGVLTPTECRGIHPRPKGTGYGKNRRWRFIPVLEAIGEHGKSSGAVAALILNDSPPYQGAVTFAMPTDDPAFLGSDEVLDGLAGIARRMLDGVFLHEGGSEFYAYKSGEAVRLGASVRAFGTGMPEGQVRVAVTDPSGAELFSAESPVSAAGHGPGSFETIWSPDELTEDDYTVRVTLIRDGVAIDEMTHPIVVWRPKAPPEFMEAHDGRFWLNGQPWFAHGVNYMPSSGVGIEDGPYFEYFFDPQPYDPDVIERDLSDIAETGMNMVSVFIYYRSLESRNLWDLLTRCERHGLKVNLSLRPGTPMDFRWDEMRALIERHELAQCDTVFAYDLAWEPFFGAYDGRSVWDGRWEAWLVEQFGSVEAAEGSWGMPAPRTAEGKVTGPSDQQLALDGDWRTMVASYRRFVDALANEKYGEARRLVRSVDPNHLVSFRMTMAGDPLHYQGHMPFDFAGLAGAVDIMEPEGYGRIGDWERVKPGWFTTAYSRAVAPDAPVMWAEFGVHTWDNNAMRTDEGLLEFQGRFYRDFYEMVLRSGADGTVCWWFPGGYRYGERSDYGILNPDRTWRPSTTVISEYAARMTAPRPVPKPDVWLDISRDAHANGIHGIYEQIKDEFWQAIDDGKTPGLRWVDTP